MVCDGLETLTDQGIQGLMTYPLSCDGFFYAKILFAIWTILGLGTFFEERLRKGEGNILSSFAISSLAIIVIATVGSMLGLVTEGILTLTFVFGLIFIAIWYFKKD